MVTMTAPRVSSADAAATGPDPVKKSESRSLGFYYGNFQALKNISMPIYEKKVTALIGPSGCGKSTYLRCFNRMHDLYPGNRYEGQIMLYPDNTNMLNPVVDPIEVRMRISMVFQKPNPFPKSIYENVAYGLRVRGERKRALLDGQVEEALRSTSPVASSSAFALRGRWRPIRRCCCSTNRPRRSIRLPRPASNT
jgi:phosphate transport system ATP-binding protein